MFEEEPTDKMKYFLNEIGVPLPKLKEICSLIREIVA